MTNQVIQKGRVQTFFERDDVKDRISTLLGCDFKARTLIATTLDIVSKNNHLSTVEPKTIFSAVCMAAALDLPVNSNLGFAYIVPYNGKAQLQIGYKGFIQLAQRSGMMRRINTCAVYEGDTEHSVRARLTSLLPSNSPSNRIIGYVAYFQLLNGYEAHLTMSHDEIIHHANKYSATAQRNTGLWVSNFAAMAKKTVLKLLLSRYAPLSLEMQTAIQADQSVVNGVQNPNFEYIDVPSN